MLHKHQELIKYLMAGVINTLVGYGVFLSLFAGLNFSPELANAGGYIAGLLTAFTLNYFFVFTGAGMSRATVLRFVAASLLAFLINQAVLITLCRVLSVSPELAQIVAMVAYTVIFYLLNKYFVFALADNEEKFEGSAH